MMSLFYRAWANSRAPVSYDQPDSDPFSGYLGALFGYGQPGFTQRDSVPDRAKAYFAGLLALQTRHPDGLRAILGMYFGLSIDVREFIGEWIEIPLEARCRLGESPKTGTLGETAVAGARTFSARHKFRLIIGPLPLSAFESFLPGGDTLPVLVAFVRTYCGDEWAWDVNLVLAADETPTAQPGTFGRLGWTTWLHSDARADDAEDLVLDAMAYVDGAKSGSQEDAARL
jgi:type VI secretion system protein ImpH